MSEELPLLFPSFSVKYSATTAWSPALNSLHNVWYTDVIPENSRTAQSRTDTPPRVSRPVPTPPVSEETQPEDRLCSIARPERHPTDRGTNTTGNMPDENRRVGQHATSNYEDSSDQSEQNIYRSSPGQSEDPNAAVQLPLEEPFMFDDTATQADSESPASVDTHVIFSFYPFLKLHIQSHMSPQDVNFLEQQTCFRVPTRPALDELVREYFLHVHPSLPIIDEGTFWEMYTYRARNPTEKPGLSLFLFQAMLFASCSVSVHFVVLKRFCEMRNILRQIHSLYLWHAFED